MYNLPYFKEKDLQKVIQFIAENPFAFVMGCNKNYIPAATQVPVFIEEEGGKRILRGHIMRNTDHHKAFLENDNVLVVFTGPHTYVSATWYSDPYQASTWNYMSVHVRGKIRFLDEEALKKVLIKTSHHFENYDSASTTVFENLPKDYRENLMKAIVAFEIEILKFDNVFKLSQNRDQVSYENIKQRLTSQGGDAQTVATEMEKRTAELFPEVKHHDENGLTS
jgi:transcriptional regulator